MPKSIALISASWLRRSRPGVELQDREFFAAIREKREPDASVARGVAGLPDP
ncbi:MAG TPA: hypothetical protein VHZ26_08110 [Caulobacteraceae bacterium]|nr:hypothetical protein [Caulobacteraceae bacterium]